MSAQAQLLKESAPVPVGTQARPPGPRYHTPFGFYADLRRDPIQFHLNAAKFGDVVCIRTGLGSLYFVTHPDHIKHILQDNNQNYGRSRFYRMMKPALGEGLLLSEGAFWRRQRRLAQPAFYRQRIATFATLMTDAAAQLLERWQPAATNGQPLEIAAEMDHLTLMITNKALFSGELDIDVAERERSAMVFREHFEHRFEHPFTLPESIPTPRNRRFRKVLRENDEFVYGLIDERRRSGHDTGDLLSMLLHARDEETGEGMSDKQLRDEVTTFLGAGSETTAMGLAWTWYLLSTHPEVDRRLRGELAAVLGGRAPTAEDLPKLQYTRMVIEEALRIYPPIWAFSRNAIADDEIAGYRIPSNSFVTMSPYVTHRDPAFWENPEGFDPERFAVDRTASRPRFAYFPFGGGPRLCIGAEFALMEMQLVVATVAQRYRLHLVPGHPVERYAMFSLRPRHGILMTLHQAN